MCGGPHFLLTNCVSARAQHNSRFEPFDSRAPRRHEHDGLLLHSAGVALTALRSAPILVMNGF
jgi:hypothetical protein